jgi:hypothetical protein
LQQADRVSRIQGLGRQTRLRDRVEQTGWADEGAGTGLSLVIDGDRHLKTTTRSAPAFERPTQAFGTSP